MLDVDACAAVTALRRGGARTACGTCSAAAAARVRRCPGAGTTEAARIAGRPPTSRTARGTALSSRGNDHTLQ